MGVVNVTPNSFSDGGQFFDAQSAIQRTLQLFQEGADLVDIGGESSRPGAESIPVEEELRRVIPVIKEIAGRNHLPVSVDTVKYEVASKALDAGAAIINDISGLQSDPRMAHLAADSGAGYIIMHMRGNPLTMQSLTEYEDLFTDIREFLENQVLLSLSSGVRPQQIALDPGIGFSKTAEQNLLLLKHLYQVHLQHYPLLLGVSRKSFIGKITRREADQRLMGTAAAVTAGILNGANIVRVHDVAQMREVLDVAVAIRSADIPSIPSP